MFDKSKEIRDLRHDIACELHTLSKEMSDLQKSLYDVGHGVIANKVGYWIERVEKTKAWAWPKGNPLDEK